MDDTEKQDTIAKVTDRLAARYPDAPRPLVSQVVAEEYETLDASRIRTYIPTLVEHGARNRLRRELAAQPAETWHHRNSTIRAHQGRKSHERRPLDP